MKTKGFTLIELLAIIILLGLIAVITIPNINNQIEKSKKALAKTSAAQYKKAVDEYVLSQKINKIKIELNGQYNIDSNGFLYNNDYMYRISFSGEKPKNGSLNYINNEITDGCITINKYKITFENGEISNTEKGECEYQKIETKEEKYLKITNNYIKELETMYSPSVKSKKTDLSKIIEKLKGVQIPQTLDKKSWVYFTYDDEEKNANITDFSLKFEDGPYIIIVNKTNNVITTDITTETLLAQKIPEPKSFENDPWETIVSNVEIENTSVYKLGDTKKININGTDYTVQIANKSTPEECYTQNFSQTACGFVIEFIDSITQHRMNPPTEQYQYGTNIGGYPASEMRTYLNETLFQSLPEELQENIIDTFTISSHGNGDTNNFASTEKLYLLAPKEIGNIQGTDLDTTGNQTRELDYYANGGSVFKCIRDACWDTRYWWLRSASKNDTSSFIYTGNGTYTSSASSERSVAPAFRIGNQTQ